MSRPSLLTPEVSEKLVSMLRSGTTITIASEAVGIDRRSFSRWMKRGESSAEKERPYREFRERVLGARAEAEARAVALIANAARDDWRAAAWLLERAFPERWGTAAERERTAPAVESSAPPDPFAEVDELAERRRSRGGK